VHQQLPPYIDTYATNLVLMPGVEGRGKGGHVAAEQIFAEVYEL